MNRSTCDRAQNSPLVRSPRDKELVAPLLPSRHQGLRRQKKGPRCAHAALKPTIIVFLSPKSYSPV